MKIELGVGVKTTIESIHEKFLIKEKDGYIMIRTNDMRWKRLSACSR